MNTKLKEFGRDREWEGFMQVNMELEVRIENQELVLISSGLQKICFYRGLKCILMTRFNDNSKLISNIFRPHLLTPNFI